MVQTAQAFGGSVTEPPFRDGKGIVETTPNEPIILRLRQEQVLTADNSLDRAFAKYYERRGLTPENMGSRLQKFIVTPINDKGIRLDKIINNPNTESKSVWAEEEYSDYGRDSIGFAPITRGIWYYIRREDLNENFAQSCSQFKNAMIETEGGAVQEEDRQIFMHILLEKGFMDVIYKPDGKKSFVPKKDLSKIFTDSEELGKIYPEFFANATERFLPNETKSYLNLQWLNHRAISGMRFDEKQNRWIYDGAFINLLKDDGSKRRLYKNNGSNGGYVIKSGNLQEEISDLERMVELDKADKTLKAMNKGDVSNVKNFVKQLPDGRICIQMTRTAKRGISPIYYVDVTDGAEIRLGGYQPGSNLPQGILLISKQ